MITKAEWSKIESLLKDNLFPEVKFKLNDTVISVNRSFVSESRLVYRVWLDNSSCVSWGWPDHQDFKDITLKVWRLRTFRPGAKSVRKIEKMPGGKRYLKRKENAHLYKVVEYREPYFLTAASLIKQYKKIDGLDIFIEEGPGK